MLGVGVSLLGVGERVTGLGGSGSGSGSVGKMVREVAVAVVVMVVVCACLLARLSASKNLVVAQTGNFTNGEKTTKEDGIW